MEFYAPWCSHCMRSVPQFKRAAMNLDGEVEFGAANCDKASPICQEWGIQSFPKFLLFSPHYEWSGVLLLLPSPLLRAAMRMCACVRWWGVYCAVARSDALPPTCRSPAWLWLWTEEYPKVRLKELGKSKEELGDDITVWVQAQVR